MTEPTEYGAAQVREPKPSALKGVLFIIVILAIAAALGVFVLSQRTASGTEISTTAPLPLTVNTMQVSLQEAFEIDERFTGLVAPRRSSVLGFSTGGRIDALSVDVGDPVRKGQIMARLDTRGLQAQRAAAKAVVVEAESAHALAVSTVQRQITLKGQGHVSQQRVDEAAAQAQAARARIDAAQANVDALSVQISLARIEAPYAGMVTARMSDEGAIAAPGQSIFELVETSKLEAQIGLTALLASSLEIGRIYTLVSDRGDVQAQLRSVTNVIDASQRTVTTLFDILEPEAVSAGAVVRLSLKRTLNEYGMWMPVSALSEREHGLWSVYLARRTGDNWRAELGAVEVVHTDGARAFVRGAVRDGDILILDGLQRITPGQLVIPSSGDRASATPKNG